jgi:hypothetical protein
MARGTAGRQYGCLRTPRPVTRSPQADFAGEMYTKKKGSTPYFFSIKRIYINIERYQLHPTSATTK